MTHKGRFAFKTYHQDFLYYHQSSLDGGEKESIDWENWWLPRQSLMNAKVKGAHMYIKAVRKREAIKKEREEEKTVVDGWSVR